MSRLGVTGPSHRSRRAELRRLLPIAAAIAALALAGVAGAGCGYSGDTAQQVQEWANQNSLVSNEHQVVLDADDAIGAARSGTAKQLQTVCGGLLNDAGTLYGTLVTPDETLTHELADAMDDFSDGGVSCSDTTTTQSPAITKDLADIRAGLAELQVANARLRSFGVHPPNARIPKLGTASR